MVFSFYLFILDIIYFSFFMKIINLEKLLNYPEIYSSFDSKHNQQQKQNDGTKEYNRARLLADFFWTGKKTDINSWNTWTRASALWRPRFTKKNHDRPGQQGTVSVQNLLSDHTINTHVPQELGREPMHDDAQSTSKSTKHGGAKNVQTCYIHSRGLLGNTKEPVRNKLRSTNSSQK